MVGLEGTSVGHPVQPPAEAGSPTAGCTGPRPGGHINCLCMRTFCHKIVMKSTTAKSKILNSSLVQFFNSQVGM